MKPNRRDFLKTTVTAGGILATGTAAGALVGCSADDNARVQRLGAISSGQLPQDPCPGRHQLHRPAPDRVRAVPGPRGHPLQPWPHQHAPLPRSGKARRRPQRRPQRPRRPQLGRRDRQLGDQSGVGGTQRGPPQGFVRAVHLRLHALGLRGHEPGPHVHCGARVDV